MDTDLWTLFLLLDPDFILQTISGAIGSFTNFKTVFFSFYDMLRVMARQNIPDWINIFFQIQGRLIQ